MGALAALLVPSFISELFKLGNTALHDYQQGKITVEQLRTQWAVMAMEAFTNVERINADAIVKTFAAYTDVLKVSRLIRIAYFYTVMTQASVLLFYQIGVPYIVWVWGGSFPSPGDQLLQWGYGLLVLLVGGGMIALPRPKQPPLPLPPPKPGA